MDNHFSSVMSTRSNAELYKIIDNKSSYEPEAYLAAIEELEKRKLAPAELIAQKVQVMESIAQHQQDLAAQQQRDKVQRGEWMHELIALFKPTRQYFYTPIIVLVNILVYIVMVVSGVDPLLPSVEHLIQWGGNVATITLAGEQWRLFTNIFLHGGIIHLLLNMYALLQIGHILETQFGQHRFFIAYVVTGVVASIASLSFNENIVSVGASGAIFGVYGLCLSLLLLKGLNIPKDARNKFISSILFFVGYNIVYGFANTGIDNAAHIGGLVSGLIVGAAYYPGLKRPALSLVTSGVLIGGLLITIPLLQEIVPNKYVTYQFAMEEFIAAEEKAMWMYKEEIANPPADKIDDYIRRLEEEGTVIWRQNLDLLNSLTDMPPNLERRISLLKKYCGLRIQSCEAMQEWLRHNRSEDNLRVFELDSLIGEVIHEVMALKE